MSTLPQTNTPKASPITEQTVLIVGGGHVGLSFALLLAHHGIKSTLLEQFSYPKISPDDDQSRRQYLDSRNTALSRRTVQIYDEIGLWQQLQSHACRIDAVQISEQGSFGKAQLNKAEENVESFGQVMENAWLGRKLLLAVQDSPLITLIDGATVTDLMQSDAAHEQLVTLGYEKQGNEKKDSNKEAVHHEVSANVLVACDGRDSTVRKLLCIDAQSYDYQQSGIVGVVQTDKPHEHVAIERFTKDGLMAVLPLTDGNEKHSNDRQASEKAGMADTHAGYRRSVVWVCPKGEEERYLEDDAYFLQTLQQSFGRRAGNFVAAGRRGSYPLTKVLSEQQVKGRCVLMGNAAHTLHPVAGQGFNLCMRDAHVLAKMLANQVMKGEDIGAANMLQRYEAAREKDQKRVIRFCDAVVQGFTHTNPAVKLARNVGLVAFDKLPMVKPLVASYAMGLKA